MWEPLSGSSGGGFFAAMLMISCSRLLSFPTRRLLQAARVVRTRHWLAQDPTHQVLRVLAIFVPPSVLSRDPTITVVSFPFFPVVVDSVIGFAANLDSRCRTFPSISTVCDLPLEDLLLPPWRLGLHRCCQQNLGFQSWLLPMFGLPLWLPKNSLICSTWPAVIPPWIVAMAATCLATLVQEPQLSIPSFFYPWVFLPRIKITDTSW